MLSLTYVSSAVEMWSVDDLVQLLARWRPTNEGLGVTGMLLYCDGNIIQTLEGPDAVVESVFATIAADPRHRGIIAILREPIQHRAFADWSMGFRYLPSDALSDVDGVSTFMTQPGSHELGDHTDSAHRLLETFRNTLR